jgi:hypothetical protein
LAGKIKEKTFLSGRNVFSFFFFTVTGCIGDGSLGPFFVTS